MAILTTTTGLAHKLAFLLDLDPNRFTVGHLRRPDVGLDLELALHAIDENLEVQLTHTGDDGLAGLFVREHAERGIFLRQLVQGNAHLFLVDLGLGLHGL